MRMGTSQTLAALVAATVLPMALFIACSGKREDAAVAFARPVPAEASGAAEAAAEPVSVPVFCGFEDARYQMFDGLIARYVADYNARRCVWAGATEAQAAAMPEITAAQVKAHMIQETGGGDVRSRAAWLKDPLQVNVPGDWNPYKRYLGLREPRRRNEGSAERNLRAGIMLLARKGFGRSGQPAANNSAGVFDGWEVALQRYNGRSDKAADGRTYRENYAERIQDRAANPQERTPISILTKKKGEAQQGK